MPLEVAVFEYRKQFNMSADEFRRIGWLDFLRDQTLMQLESKYQDDPPPRQNKKRW